MSLFIRWTNNGCEETIVYLHGFMGRSEDWGLVLEKIGAAYNYITFDLPGHARSPIKTDCSLDKTAWEIEQRLEGVKRRDIHLVGYSMGGRIALYYTLRYPHRVKSLVLESASPGLEDIAEREARRIADRAAAKKLRKDFSAFLTEWYDQPLFAGLKKRTAFPELLKRRLNNDPEELATALQKLSVASQPNLWPHLKELTCPVMLICGALDEKYMRISEEMLKINPAFKRQVITGCGHNVHFENPDKFSKALKEFYVKIQDRLITNTSSLQSI